MPTHLCAVHAVMLGKKHRRSSTVQEEGLTDEGRHHLLSLHKQAHDKRGIAESLHAQITRARLTDKRGIAESLHAQITRARLTDKRGIAESLHAQITRARLTDKRGIAESLHAQITRARLTACVRWAYWEKCQNSQNSPPPTFWGSFKFIAHGCNFERLQYNWGEPEQAPH